MIVNRSVVSRSVVNRVAGIGLAASVAVLTGCGTSPQSSGAPTASNSPSVVVESSGSPSATSAAPSPADTSPTAEATTTSAGSDSGSKPSKSNTVAGLTKFYQTSQHLPSAKAQKFATCMVGQMYDKASPSTITAMKDGDPTEISTSDRELLGKSAVTCQSALQ